jgi:hypothetical protein
MENFSSHKGLKPPLWDKVRAVISTSGFKAATGGALDGGLDVSWFHSLPGTQFPKNRVSRGRTNHIQHH